MAGLRFQQSDDSDAGSYAALPGTAESQFVPHNMTPMKAKLGSGREISGCHPSRWIYELINNNFTSYEPSGSVDRSGPDKTTAWDHPHRLVINGNQSFSTPHSRVLSSICLDCRFHFVFKMLWDELHANWLCHPSQARWPLRDSQFPWHHLVRVGSAADAELLADAGKYYPLLSRENYVCSAPPCTFQLTLEVSSPRMPSWWVSLLLDHEAIREQLRLAREREPRRYDGATEDWVHQAPLNLNTYLKNLLESGPEDVRTISKRNKRFAVLFGPRCYSIFRQLEFSEQVQVENDLDEGSFTPKPPTPPGGLSGSTELGTYRAYLEDVRSEVQCLIHQTGQATERPTYCIPVLHADLRCQEVLNPGPKETLNAVPYTVLGVLPNQSREVMVNAYKRQWELVPSQRRVLVESLMAVANEMGDELLSDYAITQSSVFDNQLQRQASGDDDGIVSQALNYLGLQPPNNYSADMVIQAFRQKLARDPADASTARSMLMLIARASSNDSYQTALLMESDAKMSAETARVMLGMGQQILPWHTVAEYAKNKLDKSKAIEETAVYLDALEAIAEDMNSPELLENVLKMRLASGVFDPSSSGSHTAVDKKAADLTLPVGLYNIGNTCYLNSLLQYLFTVKPIRDIVLNYDDSRLDLTDASIKSRLLGGNKMQMDRGEAVVAQAYTNKKAVAQELAVLFQNLEASDEAATRPSQRLANAVLLSTHTLLHSPKQFSEPLAEPPPLPARPSPALPSNSTDDVDMTSSDMTPVPEPMDTASNSSSKTLVDAEDAQSDHSYEKVETMESIAANGVPEAMQESILDRNSTMINQDGLSQQALQSRLSSRSSEAISKPTQAHSDVDMTDVVEPETIDQKVLNALEHQKRSSGTDQQDVEEVMGSIINRLQAAIRPSSVDEVTGIQLEAIMETFFVTTVNYTKKFDEESYQHEISFDRSITAFPAPDGPCSLYDALGRNFDQQILDESKLSRYTAIKTLPPVLHVLIQRSQSMGSKNGNPVVIPETLYLDRYMDAPHDSPVFRRRVEDWAITDRLADVKSQLAGVEASPLHNDLLKDLLAADQRTGVTGGPSQGPDKGSCQEWDVGETWDFDGPVEDNLEASVDLEADSSLPGDAGALYSMGEALKVDETYAALRALMKAELQERQETLENHRESMQNIPYRLHAVICHRGHLMSGHYWVWICDFEDRVWRWYNDADVRENKDTAEVLHTLSTSGEPYFLCYVRDEDKEKYVEVPKRRRTPPPAVERPATTTVLSPPLVKPDEDVDVTGVEVESAAPQSACPSAAPPTPEYRVE